MKRILPSVIIVLLLISSNNINAQWWAQWWYLSIIDFNQGVNVGNNFEIDQKKQSRAFMNTHLAHISTGIYKNIGLGVTAIEYVYYESFQGNSLLPVYIYVPLRIVERKQKNIFGYESLFISAYTGGSYWLQMTKGDNLKNYHKTGITSIITFRLFDDDPYGYITFRLDAGFMYVGLTDRRKGVPIYFSIGLGYVSQVFIF